jgi:TetR/AcrR family tetracycline transcriptional repressor
MAITATEATRRGRGRPPRLSRDQIVEAALDVLEREPNTALTIKLVAEAVGSAPMALYRYFPDRDTLLQALADHVVAHLEPRPPAGETWQEQVRHWMSNALEKLRPYSQLLPYMAATRQPVGLQALDRLATILSPLGLDSENLALAVVLIGSTTIGYASVETHRLPAEQVVAALHEGLPLRSRTEQQLIEPLLATLPSAYARLRHTIIEQTVTTIEALKGEAGTA